MESSAEEETVEGWGVGGWGGGGREAGPGCRGPRYDFYPACLRPLDSRSDLRLGRQLMAQTRVAALLQKGKTCTF